ncbi:MAG: GNAT family N-acetyltransferase [Microlunatus sp.]|nr:GNAT family N-acetyltransferase [Microlunatus sp.]
MTAHDAGPISAAFNEISWNKPVDQFLRYVELADRGDRICLVAERGPEFAGYCTLVWSSDYPPFREQGIPEICDLNVLPPYRRAGIGSALLQALEDAAGTRGDVVGLGVGLYADYGPAQRLYAARGYRPDGRGVMYDNRPVPPGESIRIDDSACLMMTLELTPARRSAPS